MPTLDCHRRRRNQFLDRISHPVLLMAGGWRPRNYPANPYVYRADGSFLLFFDDPEPDAAALFDPEQRRVVLFLHERTAEDALWHGPVPSFEQMRDRHGVDEVAPLSGLETRVRAIADGRLVESLAVADPNATARASAITGRDLAFERCERIGTPALVRALAELRCQKRPEEIAEMRATAAVTHEAHLAAMGHTRPGILEQELAGHVDGTFARHGCVPAYNTILSVRGEVLHNHEHRNQLRSGDIVLLDAGAENRTGYCSDVTRCWPVDGRFSAEGRDIYDLVLRSELAAIDAVRPGVRYRDVHMLAARVIAEGLADLRLLRGKPEDLVETGAHALFFPHGVGHLIGLDVHDMEAFGDTVHYAEGRTRSTQFGTKWLRLDLDATPGMTFTIEPGIYFVPAILHDEEFRARFAGQVDFERAERWLTMNHGRGFGGIRIEDDVLTTDDGHEVLTASIPKLRDEVERLVGSCL
jgi:Xaa-Pro aminopeptidase